MSILGIDISLIAVIPSILLAAYVFYKDRIEREPIRLLVTLFIVGFAAFIPVVLLTELFNAFFDSIFAGYISYSPSGAMIISSNTVYYIHRALCSFVSTALFQEAAVLIPLFAITKDHKEFNYLFDGVVYSVCISMGLSTADSLFHAISSGWDTFALYALSAIPSHLLFGVIRGCLYSIWHTHRTARVQEYLLDAKNVIQSSSFFRPGKWLFACIFVPFAIHGFYSFVGYFSQASLNSMFAVLSAVVYILCFVSIRRLSALDKSITDSANDFILEKYPVLVGRSSINIRTPADYILSALVVLFLFVGFFTFEFISGSFDLYLQKPEIENAQDSGANIISSEVPTEIVEVESAEGSNSSADKTPFRGMLYNQLSWQEQRAYDSIYDALKQGNTSVILFFADEYSAETELSNAYAAFLCEQPEFFWTNGGYSGTMYSSSGSTMIQLEFDVWDYWKYSTNHEDYILELNQVVDNVVEMAASHPTNYERVLFVHDYITSHADYNYETLEEMNRTSFSAQSEKSFGAYGCLVEQTPVCAGYSYAFQMILHRLGIESYYVPGVANENGIGHAWNCVCIDGEYYLFDLTNNDWGDIAVSEVLPDLICENCISYNYFGLTSAQMNLSSTPDDDFWPTCTATEYNYYVHEEYLLDSYSFDGFRAVTERQQGATSVSVAFSSYDDLQNAVSELLEQEKISSIPMFSDLYVYAVDESNLVLNFFFATTP